VTNTVEPLAPISSYLFTGLGLVQWRSTGASYRPGQHTPEHASSPDVALDPQNALSHDWEPLLDSVIEASSTINGATHTTCTHDSLSTTWTDCDTTQHTLDADIAVATLQAHTLASTRARAACVVVVLVLITAV
jgi:hypothetical protein